MATPKKTKSEVPKNVPDVAKTFKVVVDSLDDEQTRADSKVLATLMKKITSKAPKVWNVATIGFDSYHFKYESGREGDCHALGFYPRKGKFTIYLMDGTERHTKLLAKLGKHTTSRACLYFKSLGDLDLGVLETILRKSYENVKIKGEWMGAG